MSLLLDLFKACVLDVDAALEPERIASTFRECFGCSDNQRKFVEGDKAFYELLSLGMHSVILEVMLKNPFSFCRAKIILAFFKSEWEHHDGDKTEFKTCPKASPDILAEAAKAMIPTLFTLIRDEMSKHQPKGVDVGFWLQEGAKNYRPLVSCGAYATAASGNMHCLLNIAESLGDKEAFRKFGDFFMEGFKNVPAGIYSRIMRAKNPTDGSTTPNLVRQGESGGVTRTQRRRPSEGRKPEPKDHRHASGNGGGKSGSKQDVVPATQEEVAAQLASQGSGATASLGELLAAKGKSLPAEPSTQPIPPAETSAPQEQVANQ
jgi:hypothetical protein